MKLILRNQIIRSSRSEVQSARLSSSRLMISLTLAGVVAGVNYYFQNFIADK